MTIKGMILYLLPLRPIADADHDQIVLPRRMMTMQTWHIRHGDEYGLRVTMDMHRLRGFG